MHGHDKNREKELAEKASSDSFGEGACVETPLKKKG
tara:strand:- start:193 stop:300 length:108 start_codon:yes stop_codon:yes gene_type:complete